MIRCDYIHKLSSDKDFNISKVPGVEIDGKKCHYHYIIVDIKFTTLKLAANGKNLLNVSRTKANKGQVIFYNGILGKIQNYTPNTIYLIGRGYTYTTCGKTYNSNCCLDKLGVIDIVDRDKDLISKVDSAVNWIRKMKKEGHSWTLFPTPSCKELYPNMCNKYDFPYHQIKKEIADKINEITSLWYVGFKNRGKALEHDITSWKDPKLNNAILEINGKRGDIIQKMIDFNAGRIFKYNKYITKYHNIDEVEDPTGLVDVPKLNTGIEIIIDFEFITNLFDDFSQLPKISSSQSIFMIGIYVIEKVKTEDLIVKKYYNLISDELNQDVNLLNKMDTTIMDIINEFNIKNNTNITTHDITMYHWGHIELTLYKELVSKHKLEQKYTKFVNLYDVYVDECILIKDSLNFSLKTIASNMKKHGLIKSSDWSDCEVSDGLQAMMNANEYYKNKNSDVNKRNMEEIIMYNEVDCKMVYELLEFARIC